MKLLHLLPLSAASACFVLGSCASPPALVPAPSIVVEGCTIDIQMPICEPSAPRPYFEVGEHGGDLAAEYENVKRDLLKSEGCIEDMNEAVSNWRQACAREGRNVR